MVIALRALSVVGWLRFARCRHRGSTPRRGIYLLEFRFNDGVDALNGLRIGESENAAPSGTCRGDVGRDRFANELSEGFSSGRSSSLGFPEQLVGDFDRHSHGLMLSQTLEDPGWN